MTQFFTWNSWKISSAAALVCKKLTEVIHTPKAKTHNGILWRFGKPSRGLVVTKNMYESSSNQWIKAFDKLWSQIADLNIAWHQQVFSFFQPVRCQFAFFYALFLSPCFNIKYMNDTYAFMDSQNIWASISNFRFSSLHVRKVSRSGFFQWAFHWNTNVDSRTFRNCLGRSRSIWNFVENPWSKTSRRNHWLESRRGFTHSSLPKYISRSNVSSWNFETTTAKIADGLELIWRISKAPQKRWIDEGGHADSTDTLVIEVQNIFAKHGGLGIVSPGGTGVMENCLRLFWSKTLWAVFFETKKKKKILGPTMITPL